MALVRTCIPYGPYASLGVEEMYQKKCDIHAKGLLYFNTLGTLAWLAPFVIVVA